LPADGCFPLVAFYSQNDYGNERWELVIQDVATTPDFCSRDHCQDLFDNLTAVGFSRYRSLVAFEGQEQVDLPPWPEICNPNFVKSLVFLLDGAQRLECWARAERPTANISVGKPTAGYCHSVCMVSKICVERYELLLWSQVLTQCLSTCSAVSGRFISLPLILIPRPTRVEPCCPCWIKTFTSLLAMKGC
jgi:hypothetical protein